MPTHIARLQNMKEASESSSPATPKDQRRRTRWSSASSSASSSLFSPSPSASPYHHLHSPLSSSVIPFSWEHQPGVPKSVPATDAVAPPQHLPLPPPLRSNSAPITTSHRKKRVDTSNVDYLLPVDPFAAALVACSKEIPATPTPEYLKEFWRSSAVVSRRPVSTSLADRLRLFFAVHGACKEGSCSVSHATTVRLPRLPWA